MLPRNKAQAKEYLTKQDSKYSNYIKCNHCKSSENSYVMIVPRDHSEPVQIDIWHFKNAKANRLDHYQTVIFSIIHW